MAAAARLAPGRARLSARAIDLNVRPAASYRWRSDGLLAHVEGPSGFAVDLEHDAFGRRTALRLRYRHDAQRRLVGLEVVGRDGPTWSAGFTFDAAGRLAVVTSAGRSMAYGDDAAGRMATFIAPDATRRTYGFDAAGDPSVMQMLVCRLKIGSMICPWPSHATPPATSDASPPGTLS